MKTKLYYILTITLACLLNGCYTNLLIEDRSEQDDQGPNIVTLSYDPRQPLPPVYLTAPEQQVVIIINKPVSNSLVSKIKIRDKTVRSNFGFSGNIRDNGDRNVKKRRR